MSAWSEVCMPADMQNVGIPFESMFGGGCFFSHLIPIITYDFDENVLLGHIHWEGGVGLKKGSRIPGCQHFACLYASLTSFTYIL